MLLELFVIVEELHPYICMSLDCYDVAMPLDVVPCQAYINVALQCTKSLELCCIGSTSVTALGRLYEKSSCKPVPLNEAHA